MPQAEGALRGSDHTELRMGTDPKVEGLEMRFGNKEVVLVSLWVTSAVHQYSTGRNFHRKSCK